MHTGKVLWFSQPKYPDRERGDRRRHRPRLGPGDQHQPRRSPRRTLTIPSRVPAARPRPARPTSGAPGQTLLADGRVLVVGGNLEYPDNGGNGRGNGFKGAPWVMTFDP